MSPQLAYAASPYPRLDRPGHKALTVTALLSAIAGLDAWDPALPIQLAITVSALLIFTMALLIRRLSTDMHWLKCALAAIGRRSASFRRSDAPPATTVSTTFCPREDRLFIATVGVVVVELIALLVYFFEASAWLSAVVGFLA